MSVLKYFKNIPLSPSHMATGPKCYFFLQICNEVPGEKKGGLSPPNGRHAPFFSRDFFFLGTYFELFERVFVIIVGKISAANSYRT